MTAGPSEPAGRGGVGLAEGRSCVAAMREAGYESACRIPAWGVAARPLRRVVLVPTELHKVPLPGTSAATLLLAFDAGARTEHAEENGMAHFLEHLVFKGGEKYAGQRAINETAERMGWILNAYSSHDLVAFHLTVRAESVDEGLDLLTDFVGGPKLDAEELDRERGVVIQEINRSKDQPSVVAEHLIDEAAFGEHPLGRPVLGPEDHLRTFSRDAIVAFRERRWQRGAAFAVGNVDHLDTETALDLLDRLPEPAGVEPFEPAPGLHAQRKVEERDTNQ